LAAGTVVLERLESRALSGNPLGDPAVRELFVYLPPSYYNSSTEFPVVLCLAGFTSGARSWFNFQAWTPRMDERADRLMADAGVGEMILVFPDCFTRYGGSQYLDSPATGNYRSYVTEEVLAHVEGRFRTRRDRKYRGILGKSSGGYGAITIAMDRPDLFSAVACHSGDMYFEYGYLPDFPVAARGLEKAGGLGPFLAGFDSYPKSGREEHAVINTVAMSACYSPSVGAPHLFDLPFEEGSGRIRWDVWARWKEHDPVEIVRGKGAGLGSFGVVFLDCGRRDEFHLNLGARIFSEELRRMGIRHDYREYEGGHFNVQFRYDDSLARFGEYFSHG
jgi:S-formylglutathione hydrolase FrmB